MYQKTALAEPIRMAAHAAVEQINGKKEPPLPMVPAPVAPPAIPGTPLAPPTPPKTPGN
jgi:hypothetical protein